MSYTLAGNFTVLGSVANLIVIERAAGGQDRFLEVREGGCAVDDPLVGSWRVNVKLAACLPS